MGSSAVPIRPEGRTERGFRANPGGRYHNGRRFANANFQRMARSRRMRSSVGGCVPKMLLLPAAASGLMM